MLTRTKTILQLLLFLSVGLGLPAFSLHSDAIANKLKLHELPPVKLKRVMPAAGKVQDAASGQTILQKHQPEWILVGNSMLNCRVEADYLKQLCGHQVYKLSISATKSAMWFLMLKRIVVESKVKPRCVTLFFKDRDLTWPEQRVHSNEAMIERLDGRLQPEWHTVMSEYDAAISQPFAELAKSLSLQFNQLFPAEKFQLWARAKMQKKAMNLTSLGSPQLSYNERKKELNSLTSMNLMRLDVRTASNADPIAHAQMERQKQHEKKEPQRFDPSENESFLPHMIALAKQDGFVLHFHRIKVNPVLKQDDQLPQYLADLRTYVESQGCLYSDESDHPEITPQMYVDDVHIKDIPEVQQPYMRIFWQKVQDGVHPVISHKVSLQ